MFSQNFCSLFLQPTSLKTIFSKTNCLRHNLQWINKKTRVYLLSSFIYLFSAEMNFIAFLSQIVHEMCLMVCNLFIFRRLTYENENISSFREKTFVRSLLEWRSRDFVERQTYRHDV